MENDEIFCMSQVHHYSQNQAAGLVRLVWHILTLLIYSGHIAGWLVSQIWRHTLQGYITWPRRIIYSLTRLCLTPCCVKEYNNLWDKPVCTQKKRRQLEFETHSYPGNSSTPLFGQWEHCRTTTQRKIYIYIFISLFLQARWIQHKKNFVIKQNKYSGCKRWQTQTKPAKISVRLRL